MGDFYNKNNPWLGTKQRKDKVREGLGYWKCIGTPTPILSWIANGIKHRFVEEPEHLIFPNTRSYFENISTADEKISKHLADGCFRQVDKSFVKISHPILIIFNKKNKPRFCIDLRAINRYQAQIKFNLDTLAKTTSEVVKKGDVLCVSDLDSAYFSLRIDQSDEPYFCFEHRQKFYTSSVLLFGGSQAPYHFNMIARQPLTFARHLNLRAHGFFDDNLWANRPENAEKNINFVRWLYSKLGLFFNDKCDWSPKHEAQFLGFLIDTREYCFRIPKTKIDNIIKETSDIINNHHNKQKTDTKHLQSITGKIASTAIASEPARVWTRALYREIAKIPHWASSTYLDNDTLEELIFWRDHIAKMSSMPILDPEAQLSVHVDSGEVGFGAWCQDTNVYGFFPEESIGRSSTHRELLGLILASEKLKNLIKNKIVKFHMDSFCAVRNLIKGGGSKEDLCKLVKNWWIFCTTNNVKALYQWIPRESNSRADELSKVASTNLPVNEKTLAKIAKHFGAFSTEFAGIQTHKTRYILCNPDFNSISHTIRLSREYRKNIILVHPNWASQAWRTEIHNHAQMTIELGTVQEACFQPAKPTPNWKIQASLLIFNK
jgi:hypothetical protein